MAGRSGDSGSRRPGWLPLRAGRFQFGPVTTDDLVLTVLWTLVILGLVVLGLFTLYGLHTR